MSTMKSILVVMLIIIYGPISAQTSGSSFCDDGTIMAQNELDSNDYYEVTSSALSENHSNAGVTDKQSYSPLLLAIGVFGLSLSLFTFLTGLALASLLLLVIVLMCMAGVCSTSLLVALYKNSLSKGFSVFVVMSSTIFCLGTSATVGTLRNHFFDQYERFEHLDGYLTIGAISGLALGFSLIKIFSKIFNFLKSKYTQLNW